MHPVRIFRARLIERPRSDRVRRGSGRRSHSRIAPQPRRINLRPYLHDLRVHPNSLEMDLWVTPGGTARPEEVMNLLGLDAVLEAGAVVERTLLELHDEIPQTELVEGNA